MWILAPNLYIKLILWHTKTAHSQYATLTAPVMWIFKRVQSRMCSVKYFCGSYDVCGEVSFLKTKKLRLSPVLAETISLNWDTGVTQTPRTSGQPVDPRYPSDRFQTTGFSRGRGGSDTSLTVAMPTASSLRTIPHHPGIGKCSWSLLVGCKGKKNSS